jgi:hypothetical protein
MDNERAFNLIKHVQDLKSQGKIQQALDKV